MSTYKQIKTLSDEILSIVGTSAHDIRTSSDCESVVKYGRMSLSSTSRYIHIYDRGSVDTPIDINMWIPYNDRQFVYSSSDLDNPDGSGAAKITFEYFDTSGEKKTRELNTNGIDPDSNYNITDISTTYGTGNMYVSEYGTGDSRNVNKGVILLGLPTSISTVNGEYVGTFSFEPLVVYACIPLGCNHGGSVYMIPPSGKKAYLKRLFVKNLDGTDSVDIRVCLVKQLGYKAETYATTNEVSWDKAHLVHVLCEYRVDAKESMEVDLSFIDPLSSLTESSGWHAMGYCVMGKATANSPTVDYTLSGYYL